MCDDGVTQADYLQIKKDSVFKLDSVDDIKYHLIEHGSVYAEMKVYEDLFYYKKGVYYNTVDKSVGDHAVRVSFN